jgi:hypothetical protein
MYGGRPITYGRACCAWRWSRPRSSSRSRRSPRRSSCQSVLSVTTHACTDLSQVSPPIQPHNRSIKGAERFPPELVLALLVSGAASWAAAAFTAFSAWMTLGLGAALAAALAYLGEQGERRDHRLANTTLHSLIPHSIIYTHVSGLVPPSLSPWAAAPLLVAGLLSHPRLSRYDPLLAVGLLAGAGSRGLLSFQGAFPPSFFTSNHSVSN